MEVGENGRNGQSAMLNVPKQEENKREHEIATTQLQAMEVRIAPDKTKKKRAAKSNVLVSMLRFSFLIRALISLLLCWLKPNFFHRLISFFLHLASPCKETCSKNKKCSSCKKNKCKSKKQKKKCPVTCNQCKSNGSCKDKIGAKKCKKQKKRCGKKNVQKNCAKTCKKCTK